jgi:hypothetical protein
MRPSEAVEQRSFLHLASVARVHQHRATDDVMALTAWPATNTSAPVPVSLPLTRTGNGSPAPFRNEQAGAAANFPAMLLKVPLFACSRGIVSSRNLERGSRPAGQTGKGGIRFWWLKGKNRNIIHLQALLTCAERPASTGVVAMGYHASSGDIARSFHSTQPSPMR